MKRLILVLLAAVLIWLTWRIVAGTNKNSDEKAQNASVDTPVKALIVKPKPFSWQIEALGTILPNEQVMLQAESTGKIVSLNFSEGSQIKKGQVLVELNSSEEQAMMKKLRTTESYIENDLARKQNLFKAGGISREEVERTENELDNLKAEIELLQAQINKKQIIAPFNGTIGLRNVSKGEYVTQSTNIATLIQKDSLKVEFSVPEKYSNKLVRGKKFTLQINGFDSVISSSVYAVEVAINKQSRDLKARGYIHNANGNITPGGFAKIALTLEEYPSGILVPTYALVSEINGVFAWVIKNGKVTKVQLNPGARTAKEILILNGLTPGDTLVTTGLLMVREGMAVNPIIQED
jgi:membrane fusion protein, multidrug efflux system